MRAVQTSTFRRQPTKRRLKGLTSPKLAYIYLFVYVSPVEDTPYTSTPIATASFGTAPFWEPCREMRGDPSEVVAERYYCSSISSLSLTCLSPRDGSFCLFILRLINT